MAPNRKKFTKRRREARWLARGMLDEIASVIAQLVTEVAAISGRGDK